MAELVLRQDRDGVAVLTLNRPERRNAMTPELMTALASAFHERGSRGYVLTGAGSAFCVGADLKWLGALDDPGAGVATLVGAHHEVVRAMRGAAAPVVVAVNGPAAGGGMSLALAGDYCIAGPASNFTAAYFRLGLTPDGGNSLFLPALVGRARAMDMLLSNPTLNAAEAFASGLVSEVAQNPLDAAVAAAARFTAVPAETLITTRGLVDGPLLEQLEAESAAVTAAAQRPAFRDALQTFLRR